MYYSYVLQSLKSPSQRYIGHTDDLKRRALEHNSGKSCHTAKFMPWKLEVYIAFEELRLAQEFEFYLKSGSGHAFAQRHFQSKAVPSICSQGNCGYGSGGLGQGE